MYKEKKKTYKNIIPRWISAGKQKGSQRSSSSAQENRKTAGQTTSIEPSSSIKQLAIAIAWRQIKHTEFNPPFRPAEMVHVQDAALHDIKILKYMHEARSNVQAELSTNRYM